MKRIHLLCAAVFMLLCLLCGCSETQDPDAVTVPLATSEAVSETSPSDDALPIVGLTVQPTYAIGDVLDAGCMNLHAVREDGTREPITEGYTCTPEVLRQAGTQEITVSYGDITETFHVEVLDFVSLETYIQNLHDTGYNTDGRVNWVLYITARYEGNYVNSSFDHTIPCTGSFQGDFSQEWNDAKNGEAAFWGNGCSDGLDHREHHAGGAIILPDDPDLAGDYSADIILGGLRKTVSFSLVYDGDYQTGTGWSVTNVGWTPEEPREIEWLEVDAASFFDEAGKYTGPQLVVGFRVDSGDYEGFTAENSAGFELGNELFFGESNYMAFSFKLPDDSSLEGWHTVTLNFDGISRSVDIYLEYLGEYSHAIGTGDSVEGVGWNVTEWRVAD